jgi:hypothetical protein
VNKTSDDDGKLIFIIDKTNNDLVCMVPKKLYIIGINVLRMSTKTWIRGTIKLV